MTGKQGTDVSKLKALVVLHADNSKLLIQWKGPYKIEDVADINDYRVNVKGKMKVYHANLFRQYIQR